LPTGKDSDMTQDLQPDDRYDALIVGARCAGAATAMLLAYRIARMR
jgi:alkyl hydroperoxide reductase subunit AhpF